LLRLTKLHWAYYALYMEIDRGLLGVLDQPRWREQERLTRLEEDASLVFADYLRVMDARARLDSALTPLGGDELAVWESVARVQRFDTIVDAVDRKLDVLQKVAQRRVDLADAQRTRRIAVILGGISVLTVVTVAAAVLGQILGSRTESGPLWLRIVIVVAAALAALTIYLAAFFWSPRRLRR